MAKDIPELSEEERRRLQRIVNTELPPLPSGPIKTTRQDAEDAWEHVVKVLKEQGIDVYAFMETDDGEAEQEG
jgi:hypothetical protein